MNCDDNIEYLVNLMIEDCKVCPNFLNPKINEDYLMYINIISLIEVVSNLVQPHFITDQNVYKIYLDFVEIFYETNDIKTVILIDNYINSRLKFYKKEALTLEEYETMKNIEIFENFKQKSILK